MRMREEWLRMRPMTAAVCTIVLAMILTSIPERGCVPYSLAFLIAGGLLISSPLSSMVFG